jgi:hypothetical protein
MTDRVASAISSLCYNGPAATMAAKDALDACSYAQLVAALEEISGRCPPLTRDQDDFDSETEYADEVWLAATGDIARAALAQATTIN